MTGSLNTACSRAHVIVSEDAATKKLVHGFRRLNRTDDRGEPIWINVVPRREIKDAVQSGSAAKGRELWRLVLEVQCGMTLFSQPADQHPTQTMPDIIGVNGTVFSALQGSFLPDSSGTALLTVPLRLLAVDYEPDFLPTEDGGFLWVGSAQYEGALWVNNPN